MALAEGASTLGHLDEVSLAIDIVVRKEKGDVEISKSSARVGLAQFDCNCGSELLALGNIPEHRITGPARASSPFSLVLRGSLLSFTLHTNSAGVEFVVRILHS